MNLRLKQTLTILAGLVASAVFVVLGIWQMNRFQLSAEDIAGERAAMEAMDLAANVAPDGTVQDIYGRTVYATGSYVGEYEETVGTSEARVVTAFRLGDGRHVAVVRGQAPDVGAAPPAPTGEVELRGVFTASDHDSERPQGSVRLQHLAQEWPSPLIAGYVTLGEGEAQAQGLEAAVAELPESEGTSMHQGYALQWWVFAAAAIAFAVFLARQFRVQEEQRLARAARRREKTLESASEPDRVSS